MSFEDTEAFRKGLRGEATVEQYLQSKGFWVTRLCAIRTFEGHGAPMMLGANCNTILPDLLAVDSEGKKPQFYAEVKLKSEPAWNRTMETWVHGIGRRNFEHYKLVALRAQCEVWLLVYEEMSGCLLAKRMSTANPDQIDESDKMQPGGMVFFRRDVNHPRGFRLIAHLERRQERLDLGDEELPI